jgi:hypothetical protein
MLTSLFSVTFVGSANAQITNGYAQIWGIDSGTFIGVDNQITTPDPSAGPGAILGGPNSVTDLHSHFIESGPEKQCNGLTGICDLHPYWSWMDGNVAHTGWDTSVSLAPNGRYEYKSVWIGGGTGQDWQAQFCSGSGCRGLVTANIAASTLPYVFSGGESNSGSVHFGSLTTSYAQELRLGSGWRFWCYSSIQNNTSGVGSISSCNTSNYSWTVRY